jgi:hypothetical protein
VLVLRFAAPLFFANCSVLRDRVQLELHRSAVAKLRVIKEEFGARARAMLEEEEKPTTALQ